MIKLYETGAYLINGTQIVEDNAEAGAILGGMLGSEVPEKGEAAKKYHRVRNSRKAQYIRQYEEAEDQV